MEYLNQKYVENDFTAKSKMQEENVSIKYICSINKQLKSDML